jgi:hypothetical protein
MYLISPSDPQLIRRPYLISNGFYAATKRKQQDNSEGYEPALTASTKDLGDRVEIRIRDNGTGIHPRSGTRCSIRSSQQNRLGRAPASACRSLTTYRKTTFGIDRGQYAG